VTEGGNPVPPPYVLDLSILTEVARGDAGVTGLLLILDGRGQPLVLPVLAVLQASLDARTADADRALRGIGRLEHAEFAPLRDAVQAAGLASVISRTGLDKADGHVAYVADVSVCRILTMDAAKWREHAEKLDKPLYFVEYAEPDDDTDA
jgi:hypothetical protein